MRNTPYVELMRRFLKPGEVLCRCSKSFHETHLPACNHGCAAAQLMSGEELAARVLRRMGRPASADFDLPAPNDNIG